MLYPTRSDSRDEPMPGRRLPAAVVAAGGCLAVAGLSLLLPAAPTTDPWGWIVWGREIAHLRLDTAVPGAPAWKPLPVLATAPLALTGGAAPMLWLLLARAGGVASVFLAYRVADRLAGPLAGLVAIAGLLLSSHWMRGFAHGYTEPLALALLLAAVLAHLDGRSGRAIALGGLVALTRPEVWCLVILYALLRHLRGDRHPRILAAVALGVPALWLIPDWIGSGDPFHSSRVAHALAAEKADGLVHAIGEASAILPLPLIAGALAAALLAFRARDRIVLQIAGAAAAWCGLLVTMMLAGYPATPRFFFLPAGIFGVIGAVGIVRALDEVHRPGARLAVVAALALVAGPGIVTRATTVTEEARASVTRARFETDLRTAVDEAAPDLRRCRGVALPSALSWTKGAVAWELDVPLRRVHGMRTSVPGYLDRLSEPGDRPLPAGPGGGTVTVSSRPASFALLNPFGGARVHPLGPSDPDLVNVARSGPWRVAVPANGACGSAPLTATSRPYL